MINGRSRWLVAAAAFAILVGGVINDASAKKKSKEILKVTVNGKRLKPTARYTEFTAGGGTIAFSVSGVKLPKGLKGTSKNLYVACANDLSIQVFPFRSTDCTASYGETRASPVSFTIWAHYTIGLTEVTIDEFTPGVFISGRFRTLEPLPSTPAGLPPVTLEGEFRGPVQQADPSR